VLYIPFVLERDLADLLPRLRELREDLRALERQRARAIAQVAPEQRSSARNLVHYLALRQRDLRELQERLADIGLSSLGRSESAVAATLDAVLALIGRVTGLPAEAPSSSLADGRARLERHTETLWGARRPERAGRILVTLPSEAADDPALVRDLVARGMDAARINCAHDDPQAWAKMIAHVRAANPRCRILMDLAGPKLRTGALVAGPEVLHLKPERSPVGMALRPARVWLRPRDVADPRALPLPRRFLAALSVGDELKLTDARGAKRTFEIVGTDGDARLAVCWKSCWIQTGTTLKHGRARADVGRLPARESALVLRPGDRLVLTRDPKPGSDGRIPCTLPEVFAMTRPGERIFFDDGKIAGRVIGASEAEITVEVTHAAGKLRGDKGINLPDTTLTLPALTEKDLRDLEFICAHADAVGLSFVRRAADVAELHDHLRALGRPSFAVVLKIETRQAFADLPSLLLEAMRAGPVGVMIARGDLAVESGWERLAEIQEEILWICEAAHAPVVWATQVLERLAHDGQPTRAEITDAAMGERAECVMLNKGPHLRDAVSTLDGILRRMQAHQEKKRSMLRPLSLAARFAEASA
jgi:pyruvate kinase